MSDEEFLEVGDDPRAGLSWRVRVVLLVVALVVGVTGYVVDRQLRERETSAVSACAVEAAAAIDMAGRRVRAAYEYVRPSLFDPSPGLQEGIQRLIAKTAEGEGAPLAGPRETCAAVKVFPLHDGLQERRDRCLEVLDAHRSGLEAVAADGATLGDYLDAPRSC